MKVNDYLKIPFRKRRSAIETKMEILLAAKDGIKPTPLMSKVNISYYSLRIMAFELAASGVLLNTSEGYRTTSKGLECLRLWDTLTHTLTFKPQQTP